MRLTIPTNWQHDLISSLRKNHIDELYGKLNADFVGGGKQSYQLPCISKKRASLHIQEAHRNGLKFNYLLNATCLDNLEWTISGQKRIRGLLDWLIDIEVDAVTVAIPYLLELIKKKYPQLKVSISTQAGVNTIERARYWEDLGADRITLLNTDVNRNFPLLKKIREFVKCELQVIGNVNCLYHCPFYSYHANLAAHSSQSFHFTRGFIIDYCRISCRYKQLTKPVNLIRSTWIRPEDVHHYENIGIDCLKLIDRGMTTEVILSIVNAYVNRYYDGNLLDLFPDPMKSIMFKDFHPLHKLKYFFRPFSINIFKLFKAKQILLNPQIYINNRALDGFLENLIKYDCGITSCCDCDYCEKIAKKAVKVNLDLLQKVSDKYRDYLDGIISGDVFKYI